jgi:hypothetical protein
MLLRTMIKAIIKQMKVILRTVQMIPTPLVMKYIILKFILKTLYIHIDSEGSNSSESKSISKKN